MLYINVNRVISEEVFEAVNVLAFDNAESSAERCQAGERDCVSILVPSGEIRTIRSQSEVYLTYVYVMNADGKTVAKFMIPPAPAGSFPVVQDGNVGTATDYHGPTAHHPV